MTLEDFTAGLNSSTFWKEFTFSKTKFFPRPKHEVELADGIVKIGNLAYVLQLKERTEEADDPETERRWFRRKILDKAMKQIKDSIKYLGKHESIRLTNERGHSIDVKGSDLNDIKKLVVFRGSKALPEDCWAKQYHISQKGGFIHILAAHDYLGILEKLRVPEDIRRYFEYRESVLPYLSGIKMTVEEPDIMVAFLSNAVLPVPGSRERLEAFVQDLEEFDLSHIMNNLLAHIQNPGTSYDYYRILLEFARVPRSVWRAFKQRLVLALDATKAGEFCQPFRFTFPETDCSFMIASFDPQWPSTGVEGEAMRMKCLEMYTRMVKYDAKSATGVGLLISPSGEFVQLDWYLIGQTWEVDQQMEKMIAELPVFRPVSEKKVDSFYFRT